MPAGYGYIDPLKTISPPSDKPVDYYGSVSNKEEIYYQFQFPEDPPIEIPPGLIRNGSELTISAMPSIYFGNSVLVSYSYVP